LDQQTGERILASLEAIREQQRLQLERQAEAFALQREQFEIFKRQAERVDRTHDRAERIQAKSSEIVGLARKTLFVVLPILVVLIGYVTWLLFHRR
jgi:hypothetical protein